MPIVRSEQRPDKRFSIFACVVAEQCGEPERRIGRILKSEVLDRRQVTLVVGPQDGITLRRFPLLDILPE
ncbi:MAG: hypothetical protein DWH80_10870 [Planctomycetota bacterium]|nr:MAG: hypothetical protein DWH80_10870 [Planctomycetota bacterium]